MMISINSNEVLSKNLDNKYSEKNKKDTKFKDVLDTKSSYEVSKTSNNQKDYEKDKVNSKVEDSDTKDKIEELEEEIKKLPDEDVVNILNNILNLITKTNQEDLSDVDTESLNSDILNSIINELNKTSDVNTNSDLSELVNKMLEASKQDSLTHVLNKDTKSLLQTLMNQLESNSSKDKVKDLMTQLSNMMENTENKSEKISNFSNIFKDFSQSNDDGLSKQDTKANLSDMSKVNTDTSEEDNFLNSLIDNKQDKSLSKINLFASRNTEITSEAVSTTEGITVNKTTLGEDLIKNIKFMTTNAMKELTVKINPKVLGELTISLIQENGTMKANIKANSKETFELLSQNLVEMKKSLADQNIKISNVNIELYQGDTTFFKNQGFERSLNQEQQNNKQGDKNSKVNSAELEIEEEESSSNNNLDFLA